MAAPSALNFRTLDLNLLRVFDVVMAERNLTRAAVRLSITQPAVSNALRRLRDAVGEDLLLRAPSGVKPTPRAEALWPEVRGALGHLHAALAPGRFDPQHDVAAFRLAMADATAALFMPPLVAHIERSKALATLSVAPLAARDPGPQLERGEVDLALGHFPEAVAALVALGPDSPLRHAPLLESDHVCVMRRGHPLATGELTLERFCAANHLLVSFSGRPRGRADEALAAAGRTRRIVLTVNQYATAGCVVAASDLLTVLPTRFVGITGCGDRLVTLPLPFAIADLHLTMLWHQRHDRASAHEWLRARLLDAAGAATDAANPAPASKATAPAPPGG